MKSGDFRVKSVDYHLKSISKLSWFSVVPSTFVKSRGTNPDEEFEPFAEKNALAKKCSKSRSVMESFPEKGLSNNFFSKDSRFQKCLLFFYPRVNASLIPSSAKSPGWKISGRFSILRIKSRSTIIVKNWSNKKFSTFLLGEKFRPVYVSNLKKKF